MKRIAILYPGDSTQRAQNDPKKSRFLPLFEAFWSAGAHAGPAVYHDEFVQAVKAQLLGVNHVLVWHNPIEGGGSRAVLDAMLLEVSQAGVSVHTHPQTILRLGTKGILLAVKHLAFGSDAVRVSSTEELFQDLPERLSRGPRVLKQHRGHSGIGVWKIEALSNTGMVRLQHAERGNKPEELSVDRAITRLSEYFANGAHMIDQAWNPNVVDGMIRA